MEKTESKIEKVMTPNEKYIEILGRTTGQHIIKPCRSTYLRNINPNHDGATIFSNTQIWIAPQKPVGNPDMYNTGLSLEEEEAFEWALNLAPKTLSPYNKSYWEDYKRTTIKIPKEGKKLDCDNVIKDKLFYKLCMVNTNVAKSLEDLQFNSFADVVITSLEQEAKADNKVYNAKKKAYAKLASMSIQDMTDFLKVYGEGKLKVTSSTKADLIEVTVAKIADEAPNDFLATFENQYYKDYIFIQDCITNGSVEKRGGKYFEKGGEEIGNTLANTITNLQSADYQDLKIRLQSKQYKDTNKK